MTIRTIGSKNKSINWIVQMLLGNRICKSWCIYHTAQVYYDLDSGRHFWYQRDRLGSTVAVYDDRGGMLQNRRTIPPAPRINCPTPR